MSFSPIRPATIACGGLPRCGVGRTLHSVNVVRNSRAALSLRCLAYPPCHSRGWENAWSMGLCGGSPHG
ncbi:hypothetical protein J121_974 [Qipengyuania citrea LAMA 915]|uniref:Uncharacterized protein n=1 Tax=Qipengyuania citrea LAMA 915 TaxID=1306953 RepID=A0A0L1KGN1_9SPHN|nr:hypothetical protein J121_974 [Qipengyuania citrea LAMA 915]